MNKFYEQFVSKDYGKKAIVLKIISYIFIIISLLFFVVYGFIGLLLIFISISFFIFARKSLLEYEYEYFEKELTISKIIDKKNRKLIANINVEQIYKASTPQNIDRNAKITKAFLQGLGHKEIIIYVGEESGLKGFYLCLDEKLFNILKKVKPAVFNYI